MIQAPLIFRIAAWPIESIAGLRSPELAARVDRYLEAEDAIRGRADELSNQLYSLVPQIADRQERAKVLALRRALHRSVEPVPNELQHSIPLLSEDDAQRRELMHSRNTLATLYERAVKTELAELSRLANEERFQKALAVASPGTFEGLARSRGGLDWRLIRTLLQFALRAAGRATPNGLWAGVAVEHGETAKGIQVEACEPEVRFQPVLKSFADAIAAMVLSEPWFEQIPLRLNPTLVQTENGSWQFEQPQADRWETAELPPSPLIPILLARCPQPSYLPPAEIRARIKANNPAWLHQAAQAGIFLPWLRFPEFYDSPWAALDQIMERLPDSEKLPWCDAIQQLRVLCAGLSEAADLRSGLGQARDVVNDLLARYGVAPIPPDRNVLTADCRAQFQISVAPAIKARIGAAVRLAWRFDRRQWADAWQAQLRPVHRKNRHRFQLSDPEQPMPPGSCLMRLHMDGDQPTIRIGSLTPDPALFYGRFHHLLGDCFPSWYRAALQRASVPFADLALRSPSDLNAAARPRFTEATLDSFDGGPPPNTIPLIHSAVSLHTSDAGTRELARRSHSVGRPDLMRPLPPLQIEQSEWHHLPRLELSEHVSISAERWTMPRAQVDQFANLTGLDRFIQWRRYMRSAQIPELVYVHTGQQHTESLLPASSVLAIEALWRSLPHDCPELRFQEAFPHPETSWLTDSRGRHYTAEIVAAWEGEPTFWTNYMERA